MTPSINTRAGIAALVASLVVAVVLALFVPTWAEPQQAASAAAPGVHPISGRRFAPVMSHLGADWLDREERLFEETPDRALDALRIQKGWTVADVGAGSGYMTVRLSTRVGQTGKVYATDIQPEMLGMLRQRLARERITNVETVQGVADDPRLPAASVDLILMVDVYHELSQPQVMLRRMREALKPSGQLVLIEYRKEDPDVPIRPEHKMSVAEARMEVEAEGFTFIRVDGRLPRQHILIWGTGLFSTGFHSPGTGLSESITPARSVPGLWKPVENRPVPPPVSGSAWSIVR